MGNKRKADVSDETVVAIYRETENAAETARRTGIGHSTVYHILERHGIPRFSATHVRDQRAAFNLEQRSAIRAEYEAGSTVTVLMGKWGRTEHAIKRAIVAAGGSLMPVTPALSESEKELILNLTSEGVSQFKIGYLINRSQASVSRFLRMNGHRAVSRTRANHGSWNGGRMKANGYWKVLVDADDPMAAMKDSSGYVLEHRLVMGRKLARALLPTETVHHIDGDKGNNVPDNLQLRQGKHGKNVVLACRACGSHDVGPSPIADAA